MRTADRERQGVLLCLLSAVGFGAMAIFAKLAYEAGFDVWTLLTLRFGLAAVVLWAIVGVRRPARPSVRTVLLAAGLGAFGYAVQATTFFASLERIDASLASLLLYTYPALVLLGGIALGRERASRRRVGALVLASGGAVLVLAGGGAGALDPAGVALALGAAVAYTAYILAADRTVAGADPVLLCTLIVTSAAVAIGALTVARGGPSLDVEPTGWIVIAAVALLSTVVPVLAFLLGLERVGPATASIVSTIEPVVTVAFAMAVFGERLGAIQALGGVLVIAAVVLINAGARRIRSPGGAAPLAPAGPAAGPLPERAAGG
jgi:drug/metabolite transporter (DMT)-like permease